jgi:hypothetical protein
MARIFDNIDLKFEEGLKRVIGSQGVKRVDFCVGYFNLRGWNLVINEIDQLSGDYVDEDGKNVLRTCRLLIGMHRPPEDYIRKLYSKNDELPDSEMVQRCKLQTALAKDDERSPFQDPRYKDVDEKDLPLTEALKDTVERILPYWNETIVPDMKKYNEVIVAAHGNSLRGIIKHLKNISDEDIVSLNLPTAVPYVFEFDDDMNLLKDYFLGDPEEIKKLMEAVANQGKAK